ncbi:MAG: helix-turn-helix domain-containing protein [Spirochaetota bacterium]
MMAKNKDYKYRDFGRRLRKLIRIKYGDVKQFSIATNINVKDIYDYENGRTFPPINKFITMCKALDKTPSYMLAPLMDLNSEDRRLLDIFDQIKEISKDREIKPIMEFILLGLEILSHTREYFNDQSEVRDFLNSIKKELFEKGQLRKLKFQEKQWNIHGL